MGTKIQVMPGKLAAKNFNKYNFSQYVLPLNRVESGKDDSSLEAHLQSLKLVETKKIIHFCQNLNSISGPSPFKLT